MRNSSVRNILTSEIKELSKDLALEESTRAVCCFCNARHEKSLQLTRTPAGILYICHRASCGEHGLVGDVGNYKPKEKLFVPKFVEGEKVAIPSLVWDTALARYGIPRDEFNRQGVTYLPAKNALCYPIYDYRGFQVGEQLRLLSPGPGQHKSYTFKHNDVPLLHFPLGYDASLCTVIVVEDIVSAMKVESLNFHAVALLGSTLTEEQTILLKELAYLNIHLMLDGDATKKAYGIASKIAPFFPRVGVISLQDKADPKDTSNEELYQILDGRYSGDAFVYGEPAKA